MEYIKSLVLPSYIYFWLSKSNCTIFIIKKKKTYGATALNRGMTKWEVGLAVLNISWTLGLVLQMKRQRVKTQILIDLYKACGLISGFPNPRKLFVWLKTESSVVSNSTEIAFLLLHFLLIFRGKIWCYTNESFFDYFWLW